MSFLQESIKRSVAETSREIWLGGILLHLPLQLEAGRPILFALYAQSDWLRRTQAD
jgi:hypothetical protein